MIEIAERGRKMHNSLIIRWLVIIITVIAAASCVNQTPITPDNTETIKQPITSAPSDTHTPIMTSLALSKLPELNEVVDLTLTISTATDAPGTKAEIVLPKDAELTAGELTWSGDLAIDDPIILNASVRFTALGDKELVGKASSEMNNGDVWGDTAYIYIHITEEGGFIGYEAVEQGAGAGSE